MKEKDWTQTRAEQRPGTGETWGLSDLKSYKKINTARRAKGRAELWESSRLSRGKREFTAPRLWVPG